MLRKFLHYFKFLKTKQEPETLSIIISLKSNYDIDIQFKYPNLNSTDINNIPNIAEKYAELLIYINSNPLKYKLLDTIKDKSYRSEDIKEKLFFDNVISFYDLIRQEIKKANIINNNGPLISPMAVFATK
jgi:hypothetical protein